MSAAMATRPQEFSDRWREFWIARAAEQASLGRRVQFGDTWATVRDATTGRLVEQFVFDDQTSPESIDSRLALLQLEPSA